MLAGAIHRLDQECDAPGKQRQSTARETAPRHRVAGERHPSRTLKESLEPVCRFTAALTRLQQVASTDSTVLLLGETGTGKELFASAIHAHSQRHRYNLVNVNCAALAGVAHRKRALRTRARRVYRRLGRATGPVRGGAPRHDLPRRNRRPPGGASGEIVTCPAEPGVRTPRLVAHAQGGRPDHRRDASPS